jgi:hypothetical protein
MFIWLKLPAYKDQTTYTTNKISPLNLKFKSLKFRTYEDQNYLHSK